MNTTRSFGGGVTALKIAAPVPAPTRNARAMGASFATPERIPSADELLVLWPDEAMAQAHQSRRRRLRLITCPHEMVALSAAHGHAQMTGRARAVLVHVECGTQSLAGAVHNAAKGRIPPLGQLALSPVPALR